MPVDLEEAVLQIYGSTGVLAKVDDDIHPFRRPDSNALNLDRGRKQVAVVGDHPEWVLGPKIVRVGEEELIKTRRTRVEQAETISAGLNVQERLDYSIDQELVAKNAVQGE